MKLWPSVTVTPGLFVKFLLGPGGGGCESWLEDTVGKLETCSSRNTEEEKQQSKAEQLQVSVLGSGEQNQAAYS